MPTRSPNRDCKCGCDGIDKTGEDTHSSFDDLKHCIEKCVENFKVRHTHREPIIIMLGLPKSSTVSNINMIKSKCKCEELEQQQQQKKTHNNTSLVQRSSSANGTGIRVKTEPIENIYKLNESSQILKQNSLLQSKDYYVFENSAAKQTRVK